MSDKKKLENWRVAESRTLLSAPPFLDVRAERVVLPDGRVVEDFYQVDITLFVCIFAEVENGEIIVINQYKHGAKEVSLTFPGGHIDAGEAPLDAARRELREETGYAAARWFSLAITSSTPIRAVAGRICCWPRAAARCASPIPAISRRWTS